jgi:hypothetical protein
MQMVRIIGILCGSAIAVAFLIIALGVPEVLPEALPIDSVDAAAEVVAAIEPASNPEPLPVIEPEPVPQPDSYPDMEAEPSPAPELEINPVPEPFAEAPLAEHWYAFWSPFRSELAANGFVSQLQKTTGMDYRVVRLKPGVYEVAFAYESASDIDGKLAAISAATGLEMPGG